MQRSRFISCVVSRFCLRVPCREMNGTNGIGNPKLTQDEVRQLSVPE
jgi:hypothetical protein